MDLNFVGSATGSGAAGANASINVGGISGIADGDFLVVMSAVYVRAAGDGLATTNGTGSFTEPVNELTSNSTRRLRVAHKFRSGDTTITIAGTGNASDACSGIVMAFRGVDTSTPLDGVTPTIATGSGTTPNAPSVTTSSDKARVIACAASPIRDTSIGTPSGFSTSLYATPASQTNNAEVGACYLLTPQSPAGAVDPGAFASWTTTNNIWVACSLVLKPDPTPVVSCDAHSNFTASQNGVTSFNDSSFTVGTGSDRALMVALCCETTSYGSGPTTPTAVWDSAGSSQSMELLGSVYDSSRGSYDVKIFLFGLVNPVSGNKQLTVGGLNASTDSIAAYISFSNVDQTGGSTTFKNLITDVVVANASLTATPNTDTGDMAVAMFSSNGGSNSYNHNWWAPTGTHATTLGHDNYNGCYDNDITGDVGLTQTQTSAKATYIACGVKIKAAAGAASSKERSSMHPIDGGAIGAQLSTMQRLEDARI